MKEIPKFEGDFLECGGGFYLVRKEVLEMHFERMEKLEKEVAQMNEKKRPSERTVVGSHSGRRYALSENEKQTARELHEKGYSLREIGHVLKVSHETVRQAIKEGGLTASQKQLISQQKQEGWSLFQCYDSLRDMGHDVDFIEVSEIYDSAETAQNAPQGAQTASMPQSTIFGQKSNVGNSDASQGVKDLFDGVSAGQQTNLMGDFDSAKEKLSMSRISTDPFTRD